MAGPPTGTATSVDRQVSQGQVETTPVVVVEDSLTVGLLSGWRKAKDRHSLEEVNLTVCLSDLYVAR